MYVNRNLRFLGQAEVKLSFCFPAASISILTVCLQLRGKWLTRKIVLLPTFLSGLSDTPRVILSKTPRSSKKKLKLQTSPGRRRIYVVFLPFQVRVFHYRVPYSRQGIQYRTDHFDSALGRVR